MQQQVLLDQAGQIIDRTGQRLPLQHVTWSQKSLILMQLLDLNQQQSPENRCILEFHNNIAAALPGRLFLMAARQHSGSLSMKRSKTDEKPDFPVTVVDRGTFYRNGGRKRHDL